MRYKQVVSGGVVVSEAEGLAAGTSKTRRDMDQSSVWATNKSGCGHKLNDRSQQQQDGAGGMYC